MRLFQLKIRRFRGIRECDWTVGGDFVCLVGPCDSTKTTLLDAIELVLSPRWNPHIDDSDFFDTDTSQPIVIEATVGPVPEPLLPEGKFGLAIRGWSAKGELHDEPGDQDLPVLTVRFQADASLEPRWVVTNDRLPEGKPMSARDRELFGAALISGSGDRHLTWSQGSALARLTGDLESVQEVVAAAGRAARGALPTEKIGQLVDAAAAAEKAARDIGVAPKQRFVPALEVGAVTVSRGGVALHDGPVPLRRAGLGPRRLIALAIQREAARAGGITLIDEVEHGLEPYRIRNLLRVLTTANEEAKKSGMPAQTFLTTHSPVVVRELASQQLRIVRSWEGTTTVQAVPAQLGHILKRTPESPLSPRIIVCEGKTEIGLCRAFDEAWAREAGASFALQGVALADGGGEEAAATALALATLGYECMYLGDSDKPPQPPVAELESAGIVVLLWDGAVALEQRVALDLPWAGVAEMVEFAAAERGDESIRSAIASRTTLGRELFDTEVNKWAVSGGEDVIRKAIGEAAKRGSWFKRVSCAEELGGIVLRHLPSVPSTDLSAKIARLREWVAING